MGGDFALEGLNLENPHLEKDSTNPNSKEDGPFFVEKLPERKAFPPFRFPDGAVYTGEWLDGERDGTGVQEWLDGSRYVGQWRAGKANGHGKMLHANGDVYEGEWLAD